MQRSRSLYLLLVVVGLTTTSGASCPRAVYQVTGRPVLSPTPTLEEIVEVVNRNNSQIQSVSTDDVEISSSDMPASLRGSFAFERPERLRFRVGTLITGPELDLGSNDELFWVWVRRNPQQSLYYCRHERYATSPIRQMLPVDPHWLVDALGINQFDRSLPLQGPYPVKGGGLQVRTVRETPNGTMTNITVVDETKGTILQQHLFDPQGQLVASSIIREHYYDPVSGLTMARKIEIRCPSAQFTMRLDLGKPKINRLAGDPQQLWTMPRYDDYPLVDLGSPQFQVQPASAQSPMLPQAAPPAAQQPSRIAPPAMPYGGNRPQANWNQPAYR